MQEPEHYRKKNKNNIKKEQDDYTTASRGRGKATRGDRLQATPVETGELVDCWSSVEIDRLVGSTAALPATRYESGKEAAYLRRKYRGAAATRSEWHAASADDHMD